jgi:hypothetical protein
MVYEVGSLDLNPTTNLRDLVKRCIEELGPETKEELIDVIITAWESIEMSLVNKLVDLIPKRFEQAMKNERGHISC